MNIYKCYNCGGNHCMQTYVELWLYKRTYAVCLSCRAKKAFKIGTFTTIDANTLQERLQYNEPNQPR